MSALLAPPCAWGAEAWDLVSSMSPGVARTYAFFRRFVLGENFRDAVFMSLGVDDHEQPLDVLHFVAENWVFPGLSEVEVAYGD